MKFISLAIAIVSLSALAQDIVILDSKLIKVESSEAIIVRTSSSPDNVKLSFLVPMEKKVCEAYEMKMVKRRSAEKCGTKKEIVGHAPREICMKENPVTKKCEESRVEMRPVISDIVQSCIYKRKVCSSYKTVSKAEYNSVRVMFQNLPALGGSEVETFLVKAKQRYPHWKDVEFTVKPLKTLVPYEVFNRGVFGSDKFEIKPK